MSSYRGPEQVAARYLVFVAWVPLPIGFIMGQPLLGLGAALFVLFLAGATLLIGKTAGQGLGRLVAGLAGDTTGSSTPPKKVYSHIDAMEARGDYARAAAAWRAEIVADAGDVEARLRLADLVRKHQDDLPGAITLVREVRDLLGDGERRLAITLRLLDLYRGDPASQGRLIVELRRLLDERPGSAHASYWRAELERLLAARRVEPA